MTVKPDQDAPESGSVKPQLGGERNTASQRSSLIVEALRARSFEGDGEWHSPKAVYSTKPRALLDEAADKIEGLEADLADAVEVAFRRGAIDWTRLNYPAAYARLMAQHIASRETHAATAPQPPDQQAERDSPRDTNQ